MYCMGYSFWEKMTVRGYDLYVFFLCLIVFILLTSLFSVLIYYIIKTTLKTIKHGLEDQRIINEYRKQQKENKIIKWIFRIMSALLVIMFLGTAVISISVQLSDDKVKGEHVVPKIVMSDSMSFKNEHNEYLEQNGLDNQFQTFDIIMTRQLPDEFDLQLYDIVVYEYYGELIIHRIVGIEEPNEKHPGVRHFLLQGDAVNYTDEFPVLYEQMKSIYEGERIPYIGSFFAFMQSPAGYLCVLLVIFAVIATPIAENKLANAKLSRLAEIGIIVETEKTVNKEKEAMEVQ